MKLRMAQERQLGESYTAGAAAPDTLGRTGP